MLIRWVAAIFGVTLALSAALIKRFHKESRGYMWSAGVRFVPLATPSILLQCALGLAFTQTGSLLPFELSKSSDVLFGLLSGAIPVLLLNDLESTFAENATLKSIHTVLFRAFRRLHLDVLAQFGLAVTRLQQQDNYDLQARVGIWRLPSADALSVSRSVRIYYALCKVDIAEAHKRPQMLSQDVGVGTGQLFYPLVRHLGRQELLKRLQQDPPRLPPECNWTGGERRRINTGSAASRSTSSPDAAASRVGDGFRPH